MNENTILENEKILLKITPHPIIYLFIGVYIVFLILITIIIFSFWDFFTKILWEKIFWLMMGIFWIVFSAIIFIIWSNNALDFLIVTDKKIITIKQNSFLNREIIEIEFEKIQEIKSKIAGILPNIFHYGEIQMKTASGSDNIVLKFIPNPGEAIQKINTIIQENSVKSL